MELRHLRYFAAVAETYGFRTTTPFRKLTKAQQKVQAQERKIDIPKRQTFGPQEVPPDTAEADQSTSAVVHSRGLSVPV